MSIEPTFADYKGSITVKSEFVKQEQPEVQTEMENYFFGRVYTLEPNVQKQYLQQARTIVHGLQARIPEMARSGRSEMEIDRETRNSFMQLKSVEQQFLSGNASYAQKKAESRNAFNKMDAKIRSASLPFDDFVPREEMYKDPFYVHKKMNVEERVAFVKMVSNAVEAVAYVVGQAMEKAKYPGYEDLPFSGIADPFFSSKTAEGSRKEENRNSVSREDRITNIPANPLAGLCQGRCDDWEQESNMDIEREEALIDKRFEMTLHESFFD